MTAGLQARLCVDFDGAAGRTRCRVSTQPPLDLRGPLNTDEAGHDLYFLRNNTCGVLGGDTLDVRVCAGPGSRVRVAPPSSTKVFAGREPSRSSLRIEVQTGASLVWGPHPLILQAGCDYSQETTIALQGGVVVYSDVVVMGRLAGGEFVAFRCFESHLAVVDVDGTPLYEERYALSRQTQPKLATSLAGFGALASVYALGLPDTDVLPSDVVDGEFAGSGALPNGAGQVCRGLFASLSRAQAFTAAVIGHYRRRLTE